MLFNSIQYAVFLPIAVLGYWALPRRFRLGWLLVASYLFYAAWDWRFLGLIWLSTATDYFVGLGLERSDSERRRKALLWVSVAVNLGILASFKYFDFFVGSAADLVRAVGFEASEPVLRILLPVGISFYTFQTMSYSFDVYRRRIPACRQPVVFATYVAFFPQLVAGPIERAHHLLPQFTDGADPPDENQVETALLLILMGLVKKVVIGDSLAPVVDAAFDDPGAFGSFGLVIGVVGFALQIYADFGGYTDIARGSARLFGIELIHNFRQPYLSRTITEFWRRWHISLSNWLRDYLYIPIGGNRRGPARTYLNLMITMVLGGLWHGASWTFVVWGALHGLFLAVHRLYRPRPVSSDRLPTLREMPAVLGTFALVCFAWVFFRAASLADAGAVIRGIADLQPGAMPADWLLVVVAAAVLVAIDVLTRLRVPWLWRPSRSPVLVGALTGFGILGLLVFSGTDPVPFVYFQF